MTMETRRPKTYGTQQKGEVYSNTSLPQETGNISNEQPNLAPKAIRERRTKEEQTKPKVSRRKEIIKIKEEINKIKIKRQ